MEFPAQANKVRDVENEWEPGWVIVKSSTNSEAVSQRPSMISRSAETVKRLLAKWRTSSSGAADPVPSRRQSLPTTQTDKTAAPIEHEVAPPWTDENIFHLHAEATKHVRELVQELHERLEREAGHRRNLASLLSRFDHERGLSAHHSQCIAFRGRL
ncbi:hypothetical protein C8034_v007558 [Colletotrichum sidae]|uniref:Uncharacterized protein n=1 Tax=Colletotrichum sidae TaxID=1347389 RepID=A0A4R8T2W9_9PEZI|nr:hypothetical protein C8034_v007558 [Colletotrichum sidae]